MHEWESGAKACQNAACVNQISQVLLPPPDGRLIYLNRERVPLKGGGKMVTTNAEEEGKNEK